MSGGRVTFYRRDGLRLDEIECTCTRSWMLNGIGQARISIPRNDAKVSRRNIDFGAYVLIEHPRVGDWGGVIWPQLQWTDKTVELIAYDPAFLLKQRRVGNGAITGTAGQMMSQLVDIANQQENARVAVGSIVSNGPSWTETLKYASIYDTMIKLAQRSGQEWSFTSGLDKDGRLTFYANWHVKKGKNYNKRLEEGTHFEKPSGVAIVVSGDIANDILVFGYSSSSSQLVVSNKIDQASVDRYGLRQYSLGIESNNAAAVAAQAQVLLDQRAWPVVSHRLVLLDVDNAFNYAGLGDRFICRRVDYGLGVDGTPGYTFRARVIAREFDETEGKMPLTVDEEQVLDI